MKKIFVVILIVISNYSFSQKDKIMAELRKEYLSLDKLNLESVKSVIKTLNDFNIDSIVRENYITSLSNLIKNKCDNDFDVFRYMEYLISKLSLEQSITNYCPQYILYENIKFFQTFTINVSSDILSYYIEKKGKDRKKIMWQANVDFLISINDYNFYYNKTTDTLEITVSKPELAMLNGNNSIIKRKWFCKLKRKDFPYYANHFLITNQDTLIVPKEKFKMKFTRAKSEEVNKIIEKKIILYANLQAKGNVKVIFKTD